MFFHQKNHGHHGHDQHSHDKKMNVDINIKVNVNNLPSLKYEMGNADIPKDMVNAFQKQQG